MHRPQKKEESLSLLPVKHSGENVMLRVCLLSAVYGGSVGRIKAKLRPEYYQCILYLDISPNVRTPGSSCPERCPKSYLKTLKSHNLPLQKDSNFRGFLFLLSFCTVTSDVLLNDSYTKVFDFFQKLSFLL